MERIARIPIIHRWMLHYMNYGLSYMEKYIFNMWNNTDIKEIFPKLYISNYSTSTNRSLLQNIGITHIFTINSFFNPPFPTDFQYQYYPAYDDSNQDITPFLDHFIYMARGILLDGKNKILIHCQAGRSRSASLVLAFILKYITDREFQWPIKHELINFYTIAASEYLTNFDPLISIDEPTLENNLKKFRSNVPIEYLKFILIKFFAFPAFYVLLKYPIFPQTKVVIIITGDSIDFCFKVILQVSYIGFFN